MRQIWLVASNHARILFKDRTALIMMVLLPLLLSLVTGLAFGGGSYREYIVPVALVDQDGGRVAESIRQAFARPPYELHQTSENEARLLVSDRQVAVAIIIPPGLEESLQQRPVQITVLRSTYEESPRMVEQQLSGLLVQIRANAAAANLARGMDIPWGEVYDRAESLWQPRPPVTVSIESVVREMDPDIPVGYNLSSPGYVVMFGMMLVITGGAATLLSERDGGTLGRLMAAPLTRRQLMLGKALGIMTTGLVQMSLLIVLGALLFGVNWGASPVALAMLVLSLSIAATGIGLFLAALSRTSSQASSVGILTVLVLSMLGGTWWPLEVMPQSLQIIAKTIPSGWAMEGFTNIIMRGVGPSEVILHTLVLLAFGAVFLSLGVRYFRYH